MKLIGNLLMTVTLLAGLLAAATSYLAPVGMPDNAWQTGVSDSGQTEYLISNNPAGATRTSDEEVADLKAQYQSGAITAQDYLAQSEALHAVVDADKPLTPEAVAEIKSNTLEVGGESRKVSYVNVKSFSLTRWKHNWVFGLCALGLFTGSMMVRTATKQEIAAHAGVEHESHHDSPEGLLAQTRLEIDRLRSDLARLTSERERTHLIVERVGSLQKKQLADFVDARPALIGRLGLGGYAELMDRFAAAERQINRAWSIAADGYYDEAGECLENGAHLLVEAQERLR
ncbi:MAG: hypothetical protein H6813_01085 [Phycisphaeraceae bacterium]|nr:hypothetical protein [Phycisphaeraceae bacterium]MCB9847320.1 hypothetical protein [Phycisphaeraceae bacterium]